ncbi:hypothetical protein [Liberiplasma polymorphum]|uniref:hypothetical protein n=1 Tax=Liberiplasma polymorphum TaxID=3374570 RepID=UPI003771D31E
MKNKHISKIIKDDVTSMTPNVIHKIDLASIQIKPKQTSKLKTFVQSKRFILSTFTTVTASIIVLLIVLIGNGSPTIPTNPIAFSEREEIYTISAVSAASLLAQSFQDTQVYNPEIIPLSNTVTLNHHRLIDQELNTLRNYLTMIEPIVGNKDNMTFVLVLSDRQAYTYKLSFTTIDLTGNPMTFDFYYNETRVDENHFELEGVLIRNQVEYLVTGELTIDDDEMELELIAVHPNQSNTYVEILQEIKNDQQTFEVEWVVLGETVLESMIEIEFDEDIITIVIEYENAHKEVMFEISRQYNGHALYIIFEIDNDEDEEGVIIVDIIYDDILNKTIYRFNIFIDDESYVIDKDRFFDNEEEDEEDEEE